MITDTTKLTNTGRIHHSNLTSLSSGQAKNEVTKLFAASVSQVFLRPRRNDGRSTNNQYGLEVRTKGSDGGLLSVVLKVQKLSDVLASLNGRKIGQWYVTFEVAQSSCSASQRRMAKTLAVSLARHYKPEVKALTRNVHVHKSYLPALVIAIQDQMVLGSRPKDNDYILPPTADYTPNENINHENFDQHRQHDQHEAKRQRRAELSKEVQDHGGVIQRDPVPMPNAYQATG
jgi:hypothetical protein